jgi:hypothetical protein
MKCKIRVEWLKNSFGGKKIKDEGFLPKSLA